MDESIHERPLFDIALERILKRLSEAKPAARERACRILQAIADSPQGVIEAPGAKEAYARELVGLLFPELRPKPA